MTKISGSFGNQLKIETPVAVSAGDFLIVGELGGIASDDVAAGEVGNAIMYGVFRMKKRANSVQITEGSKLYSGNSLDSVSPTKTGSHTIFVGYALNSSDGGTSTEINTFLARGGVTP